MQRTQGFTLIEIAVVLLIVGIIAAGALITGQSVLERSRVASLLATIKDVAVASRTFKTRYNYFPGDLPNAAKYITTIVHADACNYPVAGLVGDGLVDSPLESDCALGHLVKSDLLSKLEFDTANKKFVINSNIAVGVQVSLWANVATNENVIRVTNLPCDIALELDRKLDSGTVANTPLSGGTVVAQDAMNAQIQNCIPVGGTGGPLNDPVPTLLIKY